MAEPEEGVAPAELLDWLRETFTTFVSTVFLGLLLSIKHNLLFLSPAAVVFILGPSSES